MSTISGNVQNLRRLAGGASGAPPSLLAGQIFSNENENVLYIGTGNNGSGVSTGQVKVGGAGAFADLISTQTIGGAKSFSTSPVVPTPSVADNSTKAASTAFAKSIRQRISVLDFAGVDPTGATDSTAGLQAAINAAVPLFWPPGTYLTSGLTVTANKTDWLGAGKATRLIGTTATGDIIAIGGSSGIGDVAMREMVVWTNVQKTAGAAVRATKIVRAHFDRFDIGTEDDQAASGNLLYDGMVLNQYQSVRHTNSWIVGGARNGVTIYGNSANTAGVGYWQDFNTWVCFWGQDGVSMAGGANANFDSNIYDNGRYGVYVSTTLGGVYNREIFFGTNCAIDSNGQGGLYVDVGSINYLSATGAWFCGTTNGDGVFIAAGQPTNAVLKFVGCRIYANGSQGLVSADGQALIVSGCEILANGRTSGGHGIWINNTQTGYVILTGNEVVGNGAAGAGWGIICSGTCAAFSIIGNACYYNVSGAISTGTNNGANQIATNNPGATIPNTMTNSLVMNNNSGTAWDLDRTQNAYALAANATMNLPPGDGFVLMSNNTSSSDGNMGAFLVGGGGSVLLGQSAASFAAAVTSGKISLSYSSSAGCYVITNGTSGSVILMLCTIRTRPTT